MISLLLSAFPMMLQPAARPAVVRAPSRCTPPVRCLSEMEWRRQQDAKTKRQGADAAAPSPVNGTATPRRASNLATDVDKIEMFGAVGGGTLTRQDLEDSRKNINPVGLAEERLTAVLDEAGGVPPEAAVSLLKLAIRDATQAGVHERSPQMRKAQQLLSAIALAASAAPGKVADAAEQERESKLGALFDEGYSFDLPDEI